jgi:lipoprotein-anchoring transpeptidase ErfK/SrfK
MIFFVPLQKKKKKNKMRKITIRTGLLTLTAVLALLFFTLIQQLNAADSVNISNRKVEKSIVIEKIKEPIKTEKSKKINASIINHTSLKGAKIYISKQMMHLYVVTAHQDTIFASPIACGKRLGNKKKSGDMRTPEGTFSAIKIKNSSWWTHDFKDGKGEIKGAYGPYFIALKTGWNGIGIHGTHLASSIGTRATEGCIRMKNEEVRKLVKMIKSYLPLEVIVSTER